LFVIGLMINDCKNEAFDYTSALLTGLVLIITLVTKEWNLLILTIMIFFVHFVRGQIKMAKMEEDYIWRMNNGPSSLDRVKLLKDKKSNKVSFFTWEGGVNGYYTNESQEKYNKNMNKIEAEKTK